MNAEKKLSNFIPINRDLFKHSLWLEERSFSRFEAWLYLLKEARFEDTKVLDKGQFVEVKRGQIYASYRFLAKALGWSTKKIGSFIELLVSDNMVKVETHKKTKQSLITITKYDDYNAIFDKKTEEGNEEETSRKHEGNEEETKSNKENIDNKDNNFLHIEWKKDFQISLSFTEPVRNDWLFYTTTLLFKYYSQVIGNHLIIKCINTLVPPPFLICT